MLEIDKIKKKERKNTLLTKSKAGSLKRIIEYKKSNLIGLFGSKDTIKQLKRGDNYKK